LNVGFIAEGLSPFRPERAALRARREFFRRYDALANERRSFMLESALTGTGLAERLERARTAGYRVEFAFLWLPTAEMAMEGVAERGDLGGQAGPRSVSEARFNRSLSQFVTVYRSLADRWALVDASVAPPKILAGARRGGRVEVSDPEVWRRVSIAAIGEEGAVEEGLESQGDDAPYCLDRLDTALKSVGNFLEAQSAARRDSVSKEGI